jgi:hypothetical protein
VTLPPGRARLAMRPLVSENVAATIGIVCVASRAARAFELFGTTMTSGFQGILGNVPLSDAEGARLWGALIQALRELGYIEGQNLIVEHLSHAGTV